MRKSTRLSTSTVSSPDPTLSRGGARGLDTRSETSSPHARAYAAQLQCLRSRAWEPGNEATHFLNAEEDSICPYVIRQIMSMMQATNAQGLGIVHYPVNATNAVTGLLRAAAKMMSAETLELNNCNSDLESSDDEV